uniref:helix-turn-helix domain-containing protein n=1 Tax=Catenulispora rubra TaxID=280293 RepID=UPI0018922E4F
VRLRPGAARLLVGRMPVDEVRDVQVPLESVASDVARVKELAAAADSPEAVAGVLERFVGALASRYEPDAAVEQVVRMLRTGAVPPHVPALADAVGLSERQLRRRFTEAVGYGPKTLHGILRFQHALRLGRAAPDAGLADVAYQAGYADQAHFAREVRRLAGVTPTELLGIG